MVDDNEGLFDSPTEEYQIESTGPYTFEIVGMDLSHCASPATQGYITQVKKPKTMGFKSYRKAMEDPGELMMSDFAKFDRPALLHLAYKALDAFMVKNGGELPNP